MTCVPINHDIIKLNSVEFGYKKNITTNKLIYFTSLISICTKFKMIAELQPRDHKRRTTKHSQLENF